MSKVTAPLLSFSAGGQIAKTQVYASWKGIPYVRRYVIPANPRSAEQTLTRTTFAWLNNVWRIAPGDFQAPWTAGATTRQMSNRNLFLSKNTGLLRSQADVTGMIMSPGAKGGIAITPTITPGDDQLTVAATAPDPLPAGWSVVKLVAAAILQQDAQEDEAYEMTVGSDATSTYSIVLTGLDSAAAYVVGAWFVFQRSSLATDLAYGPAAGIEATTT
jgi:hypothetical protein